MANFHTSDLHLGHKAIPKYRSVFSTMQEHDEYMFSLLESLTKKDMVTVHGDFMFDGDHYEEYMQRINKLRCRIKLIFGNHDSLRLYKETKLELMLPLTRYKNCWLSHCPIHPAEMRKCRINVHGHQHSMALNDRRFFNVNPDCNGYKLVPFEDILERKNYIKEISGV